MNQTAKKQTTLNFKVGSPAASSISEGVGMAAIQETVEKINDVSSTTPSQHKLYMESMTERELRAFKIAKNHLGHSFHIEKSVGYKEFSAAAAAAAAAAASSK